MFTYQPTANFSFSKQIKCVLRKFPPGARKSLHLTLHSHIYKYFITLIWFFDSLFVVVLTSCIGIAHPRMKMDMAFWWKLWVELQRSEEKNLTLKELQHLTHLSYCVSIRPGPFFVRFHEAEKKFSSARFYRRDRRAFSCYATRKTINPFLKLKIQKKIFERHLSESRCFLESWVGGEKRKNFFNSTKEGEEHYRKYFLNIFYYHREAFGRVLGCTWKIQNFPP